MVEVSTILALWAVFWGSLLTRCIATKKGRLPFKFEPADQNLIGVYRTLVDLDDICELPINAVLDAGANSGDWSADMKRYFPNATFFLIEGNDQLQPILKEKGFRHFIGLVGETKQEVKFYVQGGGSTGNSMFRESGWKNVEAVTAMTYPIDEIVKMKNVGPFDFFKLDVQGAELLALRGAKETLKSVTTLTLEFSVMNFNPGGAMFFEVFEELAKQGFELFDIVSVMRGNKMSLVQFDAIFVKKSLPVWSHRCLTNIWPVAEKSTLRPVVPKVVNKKNNNKVIQKDKLIGLVNTMEQWKNKCSLDVRSVIHVGGTTGSGTIIANLHARFPTAKLQLIDGDPEFAIKNKRLVAAFTTAFVSDRKGTGVKFTRNADGQLEIYDSVFSIQNKSAEILVDTTTLDTIVKSDLLGDTSVLIILARNSELHALRGATTTLKQVEIVVVAVSVVRPSEGKNLASFEPVTTLLHEYGFALYDMIRMQRHHRMLLYVNLVFVKHHSRLWSLECTGYPAPDFTKAV